MRLLLLFTLIPFIELVILLQVHHAISEVWGNGVGLLITVGTIIFTGIVGAALARQQGLSVIRQVQQQMGQAQVPGEALADGILVLIGAALLLTPGFLTDIFGFSLLIPGSRRFYRHRIIKWFQQRVRVHKSGGADVFVVDPVEREPSINEVERMESDNL
ncbi:MAG: FxsA family protein [Planctomicrobium sp.]|nr:FxsA family protein [Planctomicrobium sp.]